MLANFDPFGMVKISEQVDMLSSLAGNSRSINRIRREIVQLTERVDEMIGQNTNYMIELNNTSELVADKGVVDDKDVSEVSWNVSDYFAEVAVLDNQVVSVREISGQFNMAIVRQKTDMVIRRVNEMLSSVSLKSSVEQEVSSPDLVIVPKSVVSVEEKIDDRTDDFNNETLLETKSDNESFNLQLTLLPRHDELDKEDNDYNDEDMYDSLTSSFDESDVDELTTPILAISSDSNTQGSETISTNLSIDGYDDDIFETVTPFEATPMFSDRTDESLETESLDDISLSSEELENIHSQKDNELELYYSGNVEEMPDAFWVTQEDDGIENSKDFQPSFDDQIYALLNEDNNRILQDVNNNVKRKKLEVRNDNQKKVA